MGGRIGRAVAADASPRPLPGHPRTHKILGIAGGRVHCVHYYLTSPAAAAALSPHDTLRRRVDDGATERLTDGPRDHWTGGPPDGPTDRRFERRRGWPTDRVTDGGADRPTDVRARRRRAREYFSGSALPSLAPRGRPGGHAPWKHPPGRLWAARPSSRATPPRFRGRGVANCECSHSAPAQVVAGPVSEARPRTAPTPAKKNDTLYRGVARVVARPPARMHAGREVRHAARVTQRSLAPWPR